MNEKSVGQPEATNPADEGSPPSDEDSSVAGLDLVKLNLQLAGALSHLREQDVSRLALIRRLDKLIDYVRDARRGIYHSTPDDL